MNDDEFYARVDRHRFDEGIKIISAGTLSKLVKHLVMTDTGFKAASESRIVMTMATQKLVERMIQDLKDSFKDVDDFVATGQLPHYMQDVPESLKDILRRAGKTMSDEGRR